MVGRYLPKPVVSASVPAVRASLETPVPVTRATLAALLAGVVNAHGLEFVEDSAFYRIGPKPGCTRGSEALRDPGADQPIRLFVIRLKHARASDVAATVNLLFGGGGTFSGRSGLSAGTLSDELPVARTCRLRAILRRRHRRASLSASFGGDVTLVPDGLTNSSSSAPVRRTSRSCVRRWISSTSDRSRFSSRS